MAGFVDSIKGAQGALAGREKVLQAGIAGPKAPAKKEVKKKKSTQWIDDLRNKSIAKEKARKSKATNKAKLAKMKAEYDKLKAQMAKYKKETY